MTECGIWLDAFPTDLCERIASHVSGGQTTEDSLQLAKVSPAQCEAVLSSISAPIHDIAEKWVEVLMESESSSGSEGILHVWSSMRPHYLKILKSQRARRVYLYNDPSLLEAARNMWSIQELHIEADNKIPRESIFKLLSTLRLRKLTLYCRAWWEDETECIFCDSKYFNESRNAIQETCPMLKSIEVDCVCNEADPPFWRVFPGLGFLQEVKCHSPSVRVIAKLQKLKCVKLLDGIDAYQDAIEIGGAVTELICCERLEAEEIAELGKCPRLSTLQLRIGAGCEGALMDVAGRLGLVKVLDVCWDWGMAADTSERAGGHEMPMGQTLPLLVQRLPRLTDLHARNVAVGVEQVVGVLRAFGGRAEVVEVCVEAGDSEPLECLERVLAVASKHNRAVRQLRLGGVGLCGHYEGGDAVYAGQARRALLALRRLRCTAPRFRWMPMQHTLQHIVEVCR